MIVEPLRVTGDRRAASIGLFDEVVAVVGEDARSAGGRFVNAPAEWIVFEADRSAGAGQGDADETVLEILREGCCVRSHHLR